LTVVCAGGQVNGIGPESVDVGLVAALCCCTGLSCFVGGPMPRSIVGLLVAVGTAVSVLAGLAHNDVALTVVALVAGVVSGLATYFSLPSKKRSRFPQRAEGDSTLSQIENKKNLRYTARCGMRTRQYVWRESIGSVLPMTALLASEVRRALRARPSTWPSPSAAGLAGLRRSRTRP
jgi:hypothetical protein